MSYNNAMDLNPQHNVLSQEEFRSFWAYWNHGYECGDCRPYLCEIGKQLRVYWKEAVDVLNDYEDGTLKWIKKNQSTKSSLLRAGKIKSRIKEPKISLAVWLSAHSISSISDDAFGS